MEIARRICEAWDRCIMPTLKYGSETWTVTQGIEDRIDATEMRMLSHIYGISYEDYVENTEISRHAGVKEISSLIRKKACINIVNSVEERRRNIFLIGHKYLSRQ